jgi:hypothetical protein
MAAKCDAYRHASALVDSFIPDNENAVRHFSGSRLETPRLGRLFEVVNVFLHARRREGAREHSRPGRGLPQSWGSCGGHGHCRVRIVGWLESLSEARVESTIIDRATNLKEQVGAASGPSHLLTFVHPAIHQEIGGSFGDRGSNSQSGTVPLGVIDQPVALAGQVTVQCVQGGP